MTRPVDQEPVDQEARESAANDLSTTFFVEAAAGTGKTTSLVARIVSAVGCRRARLREIVAITFTEKAAGELKIRLREDLEKNLKADVLRNALADLERAHITTIHAFCAWILRERPVEAAVDPQFAVADELQRQLLFEESWEKWLEAELAKNPPALRQALMLGVELDALPELAALLVDHRDHLASAKSPKSEALDADSLVADLGSAAPKLERCLKHFTAHNENAYVRARTLLDTLPSLRRASPERQIAVLRSLELTQPRAKDHFDTQEMFSEMRETVKALKLRLEEFATAADHNFLVGLAAWLRGLIDHFQKIKHERALLDFDDLLLKTRDLLRDNKAVRRDLQQRFKFVFVDEFQDTDPVQTEVVLLLGEGVPGKLFIVGDPKQSIYGFRRADIEMYARTRRQIERHGKPLTFRQNFRSKSTILDWVNDVFAKMLVKSTDGDYQPDYVKLTARPDLRTNQALVTLLRPKQFLKTSAEDLRRTEAAAIARYLRRQVASGDCRWGDVALLFRSFTGVETYGDVFQQHGVPFRVIGGKGYYQRQEIQTLSSLLSCLDNPADELNLVAVLRSPLFGWADALVFLTSAAGGLDYLKAPASSAPEQVQQTFALLCELHECRHDSSIAGYVARVFARSRICEAFFASQADGAQCVANLLKGLELARQLEAAGMRSLRAFVRRLRETVLGGVEEEPSPANEETDDVVRLLTMHKSKGLEFPVVVLPDLAGKSMDSGAKLLFDRTGGCELRFASRKTAGFEELHAEHKKREEAEEIRLLYVATTRARERLVIPWFAEKGGRIDLLARGFVPAASALVEAIDLETLTPGTEAQVPDTKRTTAKQLIDKRKAWVESRAALLARATKSAAPVSPSKLAGEVEIAAARDEEAGVERERAMEFGSVVHTALEQMNADAITASNLSDADKRRATEMVGRALKSELFARIGRADQVYRELPFTVMTKDGLMEGKIDLLFCEDGKWVLVDFKTDARIESERYTEQLRAYAAALKQVAGITLSQKLLFFLASGTVKQADE